MKKLVALTDADLADVGAEALAELAYRIALTTRRSPP